jgi:hypothetical protein
MTAEESRGILPESISFFAMAGKCKTALGSPRGSFNGAFKSMAAF